MDEQDALWNPPRVAGPRGDSAFLEAVAAELARRAAGGEPMPDLLAAILHSLAGQVDAMADWLARRPEAKPADRLALARLLAQFEGTYARATGPVNDAGPDELGDLLRELGTAAAGHPPGPPVD